MSAKIIAMQRRGEGDLSEAAKQLWREMPRELELICLKERRGMGGQAILLSCEKYFFRNGSYASLNVMFTEFDGVQTADIVGSGGGEGLFNISLFANSDFAESAEKVLKNCGFTTVEENE